MKALEEWSVRELVPEAHPSSSNVESSVFDDGMSVLVLSHSSMKSLYLWSVAILLSSFRVHKGGKWSSQEEPEYCPAWLGS